MEFEIQVTQTFSLTIDAESADEARNIVEGTADLSVFDLHLENTEVEVMEDE